MDRRTFEIARGEYLDLKAYLGGPCLARTPYECARAPVRWHPAAGYEQAAGQSWMVPNAVDDSEVSIEEIAPGE